MLSISKLNSVLSICLSEIRDETSRSDDLTFDELEIDICNGYVVVSYEDDDVTIKFEISTVDDEFCINDRDFSYE